MAKHMVIPDTQCQPGMPVDHLRHAGNYAVAKKPDVIVHVGDHWDMAALSVYDKGTKKAEGRRYINDVIAGNDGLAAFMEPILAEQRRLRRNKEKIWRPRLVYCLGNHEYRIERAVNEDPTLEGTIGYHDLALDQYGWETYPFLEVVQIDGVCYSHYFTSGVMGRPVSSARVLVTKKMQTCIMGHVQDRELHRARRADGKQVTGMFAGIFYPEGTGADAYLTPQTNNSWRGIWMLHEVEDGSFDEMAVSMKFLGERYDY
jgi:hypothetical protein